MAWTLKVSLTCGAILFLTVESCAAFVGYDDRDGFRSAMEKLLGKGSCISVGQQSVECRSGPGGISRIRVGIQAGGFTLEMAAPIDADMVKYRDLATAVQYGPRSSLLDRFPTITDIMQFCRAGTGGCAFSSADSKGPVRRIQIMYLPSMANASASLTLDWSK
jgi:hypothetical protein